MFTVNAALLDALVLSVVSGHDSYGYEITQSLGESIGVSESTLYPVLRRLLKDDCLEVYDVEFSGRNRRYYRITNRGLGQLVLYRREWIAYADRIRSILFGGDEE